jgi:hypothetical protein
MLVKLDDEVLFEIDERMIKLLAHDLMDPLQEIRRRLRWVIEHKSDQCFERLKKEWVEKLMNDADVQSIPANKRDFLDLVLAHKDYKNRVQRENLVSDDQVLIGQ